MESIPINNKRFLLRFSSLTLPFSLSLRELGLFRDCRTSGSRSSRPGWLLRSFLGHWGRSSGPRGFGNFLLFFELFLHLTGNLLLQELVCAFLLFFLF